MNGRRFEINFDVLGRNDAHKRIIDRFIQLAAVDDQFGGILQDMRRRLRDVFPILVAALAHRRPETGRSAGLHPSCTLRPKRRALTSGRPAALRLSIGMFRPHLS